MLLQQAVVVTKVRSVQLADKVVRVARALKVLWVLLDQRVLPQRAVGVTKVQ